MAFFGSGFAFASWASRIPQVRDALGLEPGALGLVLLALAVGSVIALPVAGIVVTRLGPARTILAMSLLLAVGLATVAIGHRHGVPPVVAGLFLVGFGNGTWDVAMNVEGAEVEQRQGRSIMSRFHAGFSLGTVAGALLGSAHGRPRTSASPPTSSPSRWSSPWRCRSRVRGFLPAVPHEHAAAQAARAPPADRPGPSRGRCSSGCSCSPWRSPRAPATTGSASRSSTATTPQPAVGSLTFAVFVAAMTVGRWFGTGLLDRYGRVPVLRVSALAALVGLVARRLRHRRCRWPWPAPSLWGLGAALGFPVGMSAAADDPRHAAGRVSVVASIGYVAFLAGPPLIGLLGDHVGVLRSLTIAAGLMAVGLLVAGACRPLPAEAGGVDVGGGAARGDPTSRPEPSGRTMEGRKGAADDRRDVHPHLHATAAPGRRPLSQPCGSTAGSATRGPAAAAGASGGSSSTCPR